MENTMRDMPGSVNSAIGAVLQSQQIKNIQADTIKKDEETNAITEDIRIKKAAAFEAENRTPYSAGEQRQKRTQQSDSWRSSAWSWIC